MLMINFPPADRGQTELFGEPDRLALLSSAAAALHDIGKIGIGWSTPSSGS